MKYLICLTFLISIPSAGLAQIEDLEELLTWIPQGNYQEIIFFNQQVYKATCPPAIHEKARIHPSALLSKLPQVFRQNCLFYIRATPAVLNVISRQETLPDGSTRITNRKCACTFQMNDHHYGAYLGSDSSMEILSLRNANHFIEKCKIKGVLVPLRKSRLVGNLFLLKRNGSPGVFASQVTENTIVLSEDLRKIKQIIRAESLNDYFIFDNDSHFMINQAVAEECYLWKITFSDALKAMISELVYRTDPQSHSLEILLKDAEFAESLCFDKLIWKENSRTHTAISFYPDFNSARMGMNQKNNKLIPGLELISKNTFYGTRNISYRGSLRAINMIRKKSGSIYRRTQKKNRIIEEIRDSLQSFQNSVSAAKKALPRRNK